MTALVAHALITLACASAAGQAAGPVISDLRVEPSYGPPGSAYTISVHTETPRDPKEIAPILKEETEKMEKIEVPIRDDGFDGDALRVDGRYTGRIVVSQTAAQKTNHFKVYIHDTAGRVSNVLEYHFTVLRDAVI